MDNTGFLFARPSFSAGFASVLDLGGTLFFYNVATHEKEADARAIHSDWEAVGDDLLLAINKFKKEHADILNVEEENS